MTFLMPAHPDHPAALAVDLPPTGAGAKLDYANVPRAQRWRRRIGRWTILATLFAAVGLGIRYGPLALRHWEVLRLQRQCLEAELPPVLPIVELETQAARKLLQARPSEYATTIYNCAVRRDARWDRLQVALGLAPPAQPLGVLFLHDRYTPSGQRRLVVLEGDIQSFEADFTVKVIHPAGPFRRASVTSSQVDVEQLLEIPRVEMFEPGYGADARINAGVADPADRSQMTVQMFVQGKTAILEFRLHDDDTVTMRVKPPAEAPSLPRPPPVDPLEIPLRQGQQLK